MDEEFSDDAVVGRIVRRPTDEAPASRGFKPWHRPRKQWVRRYQWHDQMAVALRDTHFPADARVARYLSMPGEDLLDVRVLREACEELGLDLRFTGLNAVRRGSSDDVQLNLSESEVRGLGRIHAGSTILRERFESIGNQDSLAYAEMRAAGPYHAINVDLCDHIALRAQDGGRTTIIDALAEIIQLQIRNASHPWVLFVTTRVAPDSVDPRNLAALIQAVSDNIAASGEFERRAADLLRADGERLREALADPASLEPRRFADLFTLGFGKWLLRYVAAARPSRTLTMLPSCVYSIQPDRPDMLSLAFRSDALQRPPQDDYGLVEQAGPAAAEEVDLAIGLVDAVAGMFDLDARLADDVQLMEAVTIESEQLLRAAHYDVDGAPGYRGWLRSEAA